MKNNNKCKHCSQKKGKRNCPALSGTICTLCCGRHRQKEINCPRDCVFIVGNSDYNLKKQVDSFSPLYMDFCRGLVGTYSEEVADLLYMIDASSLTYYVKSEKEVLDQDLIDGWDYILLNRADSDLVVPGETISPFADFLINKSNQAVQLLIKEKEEMKKPLEEYIGFIKDYVKDSRENNKYATIHKKYLDGITVGNEVEKLVEEYSTLPEAPEVLENEGEGEDEKKIELV